MIRRIIFCAVFFASTLSFHLFAQQQGAASQGTAPEARQVLGAPKGKPLGGEELGAKSREVSSQLRCPVCQGLAIGDSPSSMAAKMRGEVNDLLAAGYSEDQVLAYFERSYGQLVRLEPSFRGVNWLVWLGPLAVLLIGAVLIKGAMSKRPVAPATDVVTGPSTDDPVLNSYLDRVRLEAYGPAERND
ncbi:MAG TPA: cytochrome c-type biogenesis protein [Thermoanaerobaculia bacterium]|nr:cytochrome c-type biogenesis protein [Thermoanaerobaculia bacterium]